MSMDYDMEKVDKLKNRPNVAGVKPKRRRGIVSKKRAGMMKGFIEGKMSASK